MSRKRGDTALLTPSPRVASATMATIRIPIRMALRLRQLRREPHRTIRGTLGAGEHRVRLGVVHESFGPGVPGERTGELHGDPTEDARRIAAMCDRRGRERLLTRLHALEPVAVMRKAVRQLHGDTARIEEARVARIQRLERRPRGRWITLSCRLSVARH